MPIIDTLNDNAGAVTGVATAALLLVTAFYAWTTHRLFKEAKVTRLLAGEPRVVAYLRVNEVHSNIVQMHIANLSTAAAIGVSAQLERLTDWPTEFYFENSKILRDISYLRPHEVLKFDLGVGPSLFRDKEPARFRIKIGYVSLDGRAFKFDRELYIESVEGHSHFRIYSIDDVARRLEDIAKTLQSFAGFKRMQVDTFTSQDRRKERELRARERKELQQSRNETKGN